MNFVQRYGLFPTDHWAFEEWRHVYEHEGWTVYLDKWRTPDKWVEVFAHQGDGPLWFVTEFSGRSWARDERIAQEQMDAFLEWLGERGDSPQPGESPGYNRRTEAHPARIGQTLHAGGESAGPLPTAWRANGDEQWGSSR